MRKYMHLALVALLCLLCGACSDETYKMGEVKHYPKFLFVDAKTVPVDQTFEFEFSKDAVDESHDVFAEFDFVDNDNKPISAKKMNVWLDGKLLDDNTFRLSAKDGAEQEHTITFAFPEGTKSGTHQGYLRLKRHNLDRINNELLADGEKAMVLQWTLGYELSWNPLQALLFWFAVLVVVLLAVWFILFRPLLYPQFGSFKKMIIIKKDGKQTAMQSVQFKGARRVVFASQQVKQSKRSRIFTGEIRTVINPNYVEPLTFTPQRKGAVAYGPGYTVAPNPIPKLGVALVKHPASKLEIEIR